MFSFDLSGSNTGGMRIKGRSIKIKFNKMKTFEKWQEENVDDLLEKYRDYLYEVLRRDDDEMTTSIVGYEDFCRGLYDIEVEEEEAISIPVYYYENPVDKGTMKEGTIKVDKECMRDEFERKLQEVVDKAREQ